MYCRTLVRFDSCLLTGSYSPAYHLRSFLDEVHPALTTVTRLDLYLEDTGGSAVTASVVGRALAALLAACPALSTLSCPAGSLSLAFLQRVDGSVYPLLVSLELYAEAEDGPRLKHWLLQQPALFPHVNELLLDASRGPLPGTDMSENTSILTLVWRRVVSESQWLCLPPKLRTLYCEALEAGPPAT